MKKKTIFTALVTTLSVAILGGSLVVPTFAARSNWLYCQYCHEAFWIADIDNTEKIDTHEKDCKKNPANIYGTCQYCGLEISTIRDTYAYGKLPQHESGCNKNPNRTYRAVSSAKEEIEIEIDLPEINEETENKTIEENIVPLAESSAKEEIEIEIDLPETPETPEVPETPEKPEVPETPEKPNASAKEEIEIEISEDDDIDDFFKCFRCGEVAIGYHKCAAHTGNTSAKEEIEIPLNDSENNIVPLAESSAKEEIEVEIDLPEVPETPEKPNASAKEEIEIEISEDDDIDDFFKCFRCGEVAIGYHKCAAHTGNASAKEEIEIEIEF